MMRSSWEARRQSRQSEPENNLNHRHGNDPLCEGHPERGELTSESPMNLCSIAAQLKTPPPN
jgi:hypothetical protein